LPSQVSSSNDVNKISDFSPDFSLSSALNEVSARVPELELFFDFNEQRFRLSSEVYGVFEFDNMTTWRHNNKRFNIESKDDLEQVLINYYSLWVKPFIVVKWYPDRIVLLDRGVRYSLFRRRVLLRSLFGSIPKRWVRIKVRRRSLFSNHIVITVTISRDVPLGVAYKLIRKRFHNIVKYFNRCYGVRGYIGVYEVHEDGYPHIHAIIFLNRFVRVFKHKDGSFRFVYKRLWDKDLKVDDYGFIDCFALKNVHSVKQYFSKYVSKGISYSYFNNGGLNLKQLSPFVFRVLRVRPILVSRNLIDRIKDVLKPPKYFNDEFEVKKRGLQKELGRVIYEIKSFKFTDVCESFSKYNELIKRKQELLNDLIYLSSSVPRMVKISRSDVNDGLIRFIEDVCLRVFLNTPLGIYVWGYRYAVFV
jgi:hypothetical protein